MRVGDIVAQRCLCSPRARYGVLPSSLYPGVRGGAEVVPGPDRAPAGAAMSSPKRKRPWRCINCGGRFAKDQTGDGIHWTEYAPRDWELTD